MPSLAIDLRARPPAGEFLSQRMFASPDRATAVLGRRGYDLPASIEFRSMEAFSAEMETAGIGRAAVFARIDNDTVGGTSNRSVARFVHTHSDCFLGVGCTRMTWAEAVADLEECREFGFAGIAVEPGLNEPPLVADDPSLYPIYERIASMGLPAFITGGDANPDISYASPVALDRMARDFPRLNVVAVHGGWPWVTEMLGVAWRRPNVWVMPDLYWVNMPGEADYTTAANGYLRDRMLFATSYPAVNIEQYVAALRASSLSSGAWTAISQVNPRRLLGGATVGNQT